MGMTSLFSFGESLHSKATPTLLAMPTCRKPALPNRRKLHVTRWIEDSRQPGQAGCMRITGRLADVCAELERLSLLEAH